MTGRDKNNWRGGRTSQRSEQREAATEKSWKRSRSPAAAAKGRRRPWGKLIFTVLAMLGLVVCGWWIFRPKNHVHTHFVMLDLLSVTSGESARHSASTEFFDPSQTPAVPTLPASGRPLGVVTDSRHSSLIFADDLSSQLDQAHVVVVYLQTQLLTTSDGNIQCLGKTSSPDLSENESESLTKLKQQLKILTDAKKRVLLIVDEIDGLASWRVGDFRADAADKVLAWADEEDFQSRLVVMTSYSRPQLIGSGFETNHGRTAFGALVANGLSELADSNNSVDNLKKLHVAEFCDYVTQKSSHPNNTIRVNPSAQQLADDGRNFVLLGELPTAPEPDAAAARPESSALASLWEQHDRLNRKLAWRWRPMLWQTATELLLRAQQASLNGHSTIASQLIARADRTIVELEKATTEIVPDSEQPDTEFGIPQAWLNELPSGGNVDSKSTTFALQQNLEQYPFGPLNLQRSPALENSAVECRTAAENAMRASISVAGLIPQTIRSAEQQTLIAEDRLFTSDIPAELSQDIAANLNLWKSIQRFSEAHQRAELLVQRTISVSESLAYWAATFRFDVDNDFEDQWNKLLSRHLVAQPISADDVQKSFLSANLLASRQSPGIKRISVPLRSNVYRLLISTRALQNQLHPVEPDSGCGEAELKQRTDHLSEMADLCDVEWRAVDSGFQDLCSATNLSGSATPTAEQADQARGIGATLNVTLLAPEARGELIRRLTSLDKEAAETAEAASDTSGADADNAALSDARQNALWYSQHLSLFAKHSAIESTSATALLSKACDGLAAEAQQPLALPEFGSAVRSFWKQARGTVATAQASSGTETPGLLRQADQLSRGFSAFDAARYSDSVTSELQRLWQVERCLSQADRLVAGQWVLPEDRPPFHETGWFAQAATRWLKTTESLAGGLNSASDNVPAFVRARITGTKSQLEAAGSWSIRLRPKSGGMVDLRGNNIDSSIPLTLQFESTPPAGIAAIQFPLDTDQPLVTIPQNSQPLDLRSRPTDVEILFRRDGNPGTEGCTVADFRPQIFFRGRQFQSDHSVTVNPCAANQFVYRKLARPATASVTVFGDDVRPLAFVLDMSKSMQNQLPSGERRYNVALDRLKTTIEGQDEHQRASLRVFGHRISNTGNFNPAYEAIFQKGDPGVTPQRDTVIEIKQRALDTDGISKFREVILKLEMTEPWGITPLLRSLRDAIRDDLSKKPGIIIAITDGIATDAGIHIDTFQPAREDEGIPNLTGDLKDAIDANKATKVIVVAFDFQDPAERTALNKIMAASGIAANQIVNAGNGSELHDRIGEALDPPSFIVSESSAASSKFEGSADLGDKVQVIPAGNQYRVTYADISPAEDIPAGPGDQFRLNVDWSSRQFKFDRQSPVDNSKMATRPADTQTPWILRRIAANLIRPSGAQASETGQLDLTLMLDHQEDFQPVRQPEEIELRITSLENFRATEVMESYFSDRGAPGYRVQIPAWPISQNVRVDAAWKMARTTPEFVLTFAELQQRKSLAAKGDFPTCELSVTVWDSGILEVRLDPIEPVPDALSSPESDNLVQDVRIEVGSRGELRTNDSFRPDEVTYAIHRFEDGAVVYRFDGNYDAAKLEGKHIGFTSRSSRLKNAIRPPTITIRPHDKQN